MAANLITDRVKQLVRMRGPVIPSQISKEIGTNILMASAILSELASKNDVKISSVKFGGTPLYYVVGQEPKLQNYTASLQQKEKEALEQLKANGVLRDRSMEPATRFALRQIKDFAKPLEANINGETEIFWKWYLLANEDAETSIKKLMGIVEEKQPQTQQAPQLQQPLQEAFATARIEAVVGTSAQEAKPLIVQTTQQQQQTVLMPSSEIPKPRGKKPASQKTQIAASESEFAKTINEFFAKSSIEIELQVSASKSEAQYVVLLPSPVGKLRYYCVAKNKKTCTDADISSAIVQGQLKKLPVLLLAKGELSKKAHELLSKEIGAIVVKKI
ncbi:hypothetical protein HYV83_02350 [Candidatus Woesearchaeota archaeon]|nr:hypothetical protein [Candidatus Woesearchaeota archaeon]